MRTTQAWVIRKFILVDSYTFKFFILETVLNHKRNYKVGWNSTDVFEVRLKATERASLHKNWKCLMKKQPAIFNVRRTT